MTDLTLPEIVEKLLGITSEQNDVILYLLDKIKEYENRFSELEESK